MDFKNKKPDKNKDRKPLRGGSSAGQKANIDEAIDASPSNPSSTMSGRPASIRDTKAWREGSAGAKQFWGNYVNILKTNFNNMPRAAQEQLITRFCMIVTMGVAVVLVQFFYSFMPMALRILALPVALIGSWWLGTRVVSTVIIVRLDNILNRDF